MTWRVIHADCVEAMRELGESSVDAIVTDPPYGLEFMGKEWDRLGDVRQPGDATFHKSGAGPFDRATVRYGYDVPVTAMQEWHQRWAAEALRVLKPGGHLLSFGGTRTYHRLVCALEDAGFEIRDCLAWLYGSGFPKSLDVSKAIDKAAGAAREVVGSQNGSGYTKANVEQGAQGRETWEWAKTSDQAATPDAERWQGWGTALKPAFEPIVLARKPLSGTVAQNVLEFGVGALNVDGTRIGTDEDTARERYEVRDTAAPFGLGAEMGGNGSPLGRWPANVLLDPEAAEMLDEQSGERRSAYPGREDLAERYAGTPVDMSQAVTKFAGDRAGLSRADAGGASRFFYTAKTSRAERERGVQEYGEVEERIADPYGEHRGRRMEDKSRFDGEPPKMGRNHHPTVKPVDLMQWLCRLITPPKGLILDPFLGSGSTGIAALREGFDFIGIEREAEYVEIARARIIGDSPLFAVGSEVGGEAEVNSS